MSVWLKGCPAQIHSPQKEICFPCDGCQRLTVIGKSCVPPGMLLTMTQECGLMLSQLKIKLAHGDIFTLSVLLVDSVFCPLPIALSLRTGYFTRRLKLKQQNAMFLQVKGMVGKLLLKHFFLSYFLKILFMSLKPLIKCDKKLLSVVLTEI